MDLLEGVTKSLAASKVSIVEFAESPEYCDKPLYPRQRVLLKLMFLEELEGWEEDILNHWIEGGTNGEFIMSPNIRERTQYLRERNYDHFREVDLVGGRRSSKGFMTGIAAANIMWATLQLQDPGRHFGVDATKEIYFSCVAASEDQAKQYQFADLINTVENCRAFKPYWVRGLETEFRVATPADIRNQARQPRNSKNQRDIARLRGKALAANAGTVRGSASMVIIFDEMAHMIETEAGKASASQVYGAAKPSLDQFGSAAMIFCNSSPWSKIGKFYERYSEAMKDFDPARPVGMPDPESGEIKGNGNPYVAAFQFPSWAMFENYREEFRKYPSKYRETTMPPGAITVSPDWKPDAVDDEGEARFSDRDKEQVNAMRAEEASNVETFKVERRAKFAEVEDAYLNPENVDRMFAGVPNGYDDDGKLNLMPLSTDWGDGSRVTRNYVGALDPSSTTAGFGFALGHVEQFEHKDGKIHDHVVFDIIKRWRPEEFENKTIDWEYVLDEVLGYIELFMPSYMSFDQFQSDAPIQWIQRAVRERGLSTQVILNRRTNEGNWKQAEAAKTAINMGLVHAPHDNADNHWATLELKFLVRKPTQGKHDRVDKQDVGPVQTKDMADCIFEVTERLVGNLVARSVREQLSDQALAPGAMGGYRIGGALNGAKDLPEVAPWYNNRRLGEQSNPDPFTRSGRPSSRGAVGGSRRGITRKGRR